MKVLFLGLLLAFAYVKADDKAETDLDAAESQSFGYGYGTKVQDQYSTATVQATE